MCMCTKITLIITGRSCVFVFKQKTAYEMRISDWSSDVCSSDLPTDANDARIALNLLIEWPENPRKTRNDADVVQMSTNLLKAGQQIGRASCRERVCQYV